MPVEAGVHHGNSTDPPHDDLPAAWTNLGQAQYSFAANYYSRIYPGGTCAAAFGCETWQDTSCGFSCGRYNDCSKNALFSVGCGDGSSNSTGRFLLVETCSTVTTKLIDLE